MSAALGIDDTPVRAIDEIAQCLPSTSLPAGRVGARFIVARLLAAGFQVVDSLEVSTLAAQAPSCSTCGGILANRVCLACYEAELDRERAAIAHTAGVLDQEHAAIASQLALAMAWGAELLEHHIAESTSLIEKLRRARSQLALATEWGLLLSDLYRDARKARLDVELLLELQRAEYGRRLEAERARSRKLELELDLVRDGR